MTIFSSVMSAISTTLLSVFGGFVNEWWDFWIVLLLLLGFYVAWCALVIIFAFFTSLPVNIKKPVKKPSKFYQKLFYFINDWLCQMAGIRVKVSGLDKLDKNTAYLFVSNHRSNFDPQVVLMVLKKFDIIYISKPGNFKIPIAGGIAHKSGHLPLDRDNDRKAIETILKAANLLKQGYNIGLFPEGTRNKEGVDVLPFKNGGFKIAQRAKAPIVVMSLNGTENIHKNFPFKRTKVTLDILQVIPVEQVVTTATTAELGDQVVATIQTNIDGYKQ